MKWREPQFSFKSRVHKITWECLFDLIWFLFPPATLCALIIYCRSNPPTGGRVVTNAAGWSGCGVVFFSRRHRKTVICVLNSRKQFVQMLFLCVCAFLVYIWCVGYFRLPPSLLLPTRIAISMIVTSDRIPLFVLIIVISLGPRHRSLAFSSFFEQWPDNWER
jgi:hypothetical protein